MAPKLEPCFKLRGYIGQDSIMLKGIKSGPTRGVTPITHGSIEGSGVKADILPGGADYVLVRTLFHFGSFNSNTLIQFAIDRPNNKRLPHRCPSSCPYFRRIRVIRPL